MSDQIKNKFNVVVADESHYIKNRDVIIINFNINKIFKAIYKFFNFLIRFYNYTYKYLNI